MAPFHGHVSFLYIVSCLDTKYAFHLEKKRKPLVCLVVTSLTTEANLVLTVNLVAKLEWSRQGEVEKIVPDIFGRSVSLDWHSAAIMSVPVM